AAQAAGVSPEVFEAHLARGGGFARAVRQAEAQARSAAEVAVHTDRPLDSLNCGPGRETADRPGWAGPAKAAGARDGEDYYLLLTEYQAFIARLQEGAASNAGMADALMGILDRTPVDSPREKGS